MLFDPRYSIIIIALICILGIFCYIVSTTFIQRNCPIKSNVLVELLQQFFPTHSSAGELETFILTQKSQTKVEQVLFKTKAPPTGC